ncbi:MAG TPA: hypothetical protein VL049_29815 [Candidatus Dormibacteraeota bacterium]|nr:hypothetical protein [Candidatus Dormibacteraeota bacterium]
MILLALLRTDARSAAIWFGVGCGFCLLVQQHRGTGLTAGVAAVQLVDAWIQAPTWDAFRRQAVARLGRFTLGVIGVVVVGLAPLVVAAGPDALYEALVRFPLNNYLHHHQGTVSWGLAFPPYTHVASVVRWIPLVIPLALVRVGVQSWRRLPPTSWRPLLVTAIIAGTTTAMMWYFPDFVHLAVAAPVTLALTAEAGQRLIAPRAAGRLWRLAVVASVATGLGWLLVDNLAARRAWYNLRRETAFGTIDFGSPSEANAVEIIARGLDRSPRREAFAYPYGASLYLEADAVNPTRFQFLTPTYSDPAQIDEVIRVLEQRQVPYVLVVAQSFKWASDPVVQYLRRAYRRVPLPRAPDRLVFAVFERMPGAPDGLPERPTAPPMAPAGGQSPAEGR